MLNRVMTLSLLVLLCLAGRTPTALARDMAECLPADTLFYLGWSPWIERGSPEWDYAERTLPALRAFVTKALKEEEVLDEHARAAVVDGLAEFTAVQFSSVGIGLFDVVMQPSGPDVQVAAVLSGADVGRIPAVLKSLLSALDDPANIETRTMDGVELSVYAVPDSALTLVWGVHRDVCLIALGETAATRVVRVLNGAGPSLAAAEEMKFLRGKLKARDDGSHFELFADVRGVITHGRTLATQMLGELPPLVEPLINEMGIAGVRSKLLRFQRHNDRQEFGAFAHIDGPRKGLLKLWDQAALERDDLLVVPRDAYWAYVGNLDLAGLWRETLRILEELAPQTVPAVEGAVAMSAQMLGFSLTEDLLPAFGNTWALFDAPDHGGLLLTGTVLVADVNDADALQGMLARLTQLAAALAMQKDVRIELKTTTHGGHEVHYVLLGGVPSPVAPAWGYAGGRWVFGMWPQTVAAALRQVDPATRGPSLPDNPSFASGRAELPAEAQCVGYLDSRYLARLFYPLMNMGQTMGLSMMGGHGMDLDLAVMPPVAEMANKTTNFVGTTSQDADGVLLRGVGDGSSPVLIAAATGGLATSIALPSLARAREISKRAVSASNLRAIGQALHVHADEHGGQFPSSLATLLEEGLITTRQLQSPRDPDQDAESYGYIAGQTTNSDARNVLAFEWFQDEEGTNVLFLDSHVEWLKPDAARRAVSETYARLGLEDEIPLDFRIDGAENEAVPSEARY